MNKILIMTAHVPGDMVIIKPLPPPPPSLSLLPPLSQPLSPPPPLSLNLSLPLSLSPPSLSPPLSLSSLLSPPSLSLSLSLSDMNVVLLRCYSSCAHYGCAWCKRRLASEGVVSGVLCPRPQSLSRQPCQARMLLHLPIERLRRRIPGLLGGDSGEWVWPRRFTWCCFFTQS